MGRRQKGIRKEAASYLKQPVTLNPGRGTYIEQIGSDLIFHSALDTNAFRRSAAYYAATGVLGLPAVLPTGVVTVNQALLTPLLVPVEITIEDLNFYVAVGTGAGNARVAIYNTENMQTLYPGDLLYSSANIDIAVAGLKTDTLNLDLDAGLYWMAFVSSDGVTTFNCYTANTMIPILGQSSVFVSYWGWDLAIGGLVFPDPFTAGGGMLSTVLTAIPIVMARITTG